MFTLKVDRTGSADGTASWIGGIATVHLIGTSTKAESRSVWSSYRESDCHLIDHTSFLPDDRDVALLSVVFDDGHMRYVMVGRSWLLGPTGVTIERITP